MQVSKYMGPHNNPDLTNLITGTHLGVEIQDDDDQKYVGSVAIGMKIYDEDVNFSASLSDLYWVAPLGSKGIKTAVVPVEQDGPVAWEASASSANAGATVTMHYTLTLTDDEYAAIKAFTEESVRDWVELAYQKANEAFGL